MSEYCYDNQIDSVGSSVDRVHERLEATNTYLRRIENLHEKTNEKLDKIIELLSRPQETEMDRALKRHSQFKVLQALKDLHVPIEFIDTSVASQNESKADKDLCPPMADH